jgi:hypothetical protein
LLWLGDELFDPLSTVLLLFDPGAAGEGADVPVTDEEDVERAFDDELADPVPPPHAETDVQPPDR